MDLLREKRYFKRDAVNIKDWKNEFKKCRKIEKSS